MSLTAEEIGLLRSLVEWRRANGWTHRAFRDPDCHDWEHSSGDRVAVYPDDDMADLRLTRNRTSWGEVIAFSVRECVDLLAAYRMVPARFSSMYAIGQAAAAIEVLAAASRVPEAGGNDA